MSVSSSTGQQREYEPVTIEASQAQPTSSFLVPNHYENFVQTVLISKGAIFDRVEKLADDILKSYSQGTTLHLICVLKGGNAFFNDLQTCIRNQHTGSNVPFTFDFIRCKSYTGTSSTGEVQISACDFKKLAGRDVLLVEDIVDTGKLRSPQRSEATSVVAEELRG